MDIPTSDRYPLVFIPGRVLLQSEQEMEVVKGDRNTISREEILQINPEDADGLGLSSGESVELAINGHRLNAKALITNKTHKGTVSSTSLFGQLAVDLQANERPGAMSTVPGLVISAARVAKSPGA